MKPIQTIIALAAIVLSASLSYSDTIPLYPCDYYGAEESSDILKPGSVITAEDPDGITIGSFTVVNNGKYGLLSCMADNPSTAEDEGAVDGDVITFYIDGAKQQKQAIYKSGEIIKLDLGVAEDAGTFNLHLLDIPDYTSYNNDETYSSAAVADAIIDYIDPANADTQASLMRYLDEDRDNHASGSELARLLSIKSTDAYNYASTSQVQNYSDMGLITSFDAMDQDDCIKHICHWLAYDIPRAPSGKENIPIPVCTSSDIAKSADSDYNHWMSVVGIRTNQDPCPTLPEYYSVNKTFEVSDSLELYGLYLNDPNQQGLGSHFYISSSIWMSRYFRPIAAGLPEAGKYIAVFASPVLYALSLDITELPSNKNLEIALNTAKTNISIYVPGWVDAEREEYLLSIVGSLKESGDFSNLMSDSYFNEALKDTEVMRCFKVDGGDNDDYTIVPFDKEKAGKTVTTAVIMVNNSTGRFQMAFADTDSDIFYEPMLLSSVFAILPQYVDWQAEVPVNIWLSNTTGSPLYPGLSVITERTDVVNDIVTIVTTSEYTITPEHDVEKQGSSPDIDILDAHAYEDKEGNSLKYIVFKPDSAKRCAVSMTEAHLGSGSRYYKKGDEYFLIVSGAEFSYCKIKVEAESSSGDTGAEKNNVSYIYTGQGPCKCHE